MCKYELYLKHPTQCKDSFRVLLTCLAPIRESSSPQIRPGIQHNSPFTAREMAISLATAQGEDRVGRTLTHPLQIIGQDESYSLESPTLERKKEVRKLSKDTQFNLKAGKKRNYMLTE